MFCLGAGVMHLAKMSVDVTSELYNLQPVERTNNPWFDLANNKLAEAKAFLETSDGAFDGLGAEHIIEMKDGSLVMGLADGRIVEMDTELKTLKTITRTGDDHPKCGDVNHEHICGRPLGITHYISEKGEEIVVADATKGIMAINRQTGKKEVLLKPEGDGNGPLMFPNSITARPSDGAIFFTESSKKFNRHEVSGQSMSEPNVWEKTDKERDRRTAFN
eukprot:Selendium_serpulae@DN6062_c0_g1_i6.p1